MLGLVSSKLGFFFDKDVVLEFRDVRPPLDLIECSLPGFTRTYRWDYAV